MWRIIILTVSILAVVSAPSRAQADSLAGTAVRDTSAARPDTAAAMPDSAVLYRSAGEMPPALLRKSPVPGGWFFLVNCILLGVLVLKFTAYHMYTRNSWRAWVNENLFFQLIREKAPVNLLLVLLENLLKIYMISATGVLATAYFVPAFHFSAWGLWKVVLGLVAFFTLKGLVNYLLASVTDQVELLRVMNLNAVIATSNAAYVLIPLIMVAAYLPPSIRPGGVYLVLLAFGLAVIFLIFRALRILLKNRIPFNLQFFLYLCGLEILPYMFLVKVLKMSLVY